MRWVQVNAQLAARLLEAQGNGKTGATTNTVDDGPGIDSDSDGGVQQPKRARLAAAAAGLLADERFAPMFKDTAFAIDEQSEEYRLLHPNAGEYIPS